MDFKRIVSVGLMLGVLFSNTLSYASPTIVHEVYSTSSSAVEQRGNLQTNLSQMEAEGLLKSSIHSFFDIDLDKPSEGMNVNIDLREDHFSNRVLWHMNVNQHSNESYLFIYATLDDSTGEVTNISVNSRNLNDTILVSQITFEEGVALAHDFLKEKFDSELLSQLSMDPRQDYYYDPYRSYGLNAREYQVFFERQHEGISFLNEGISIGVNSGTGEVTSFQIMWTKKPLPKLNGIVSADDATETFKNALEFNLGYIPVTKFPYYGYPIEEVKLVYYPHFPSGSFIDAVTGEQISPTSPITTETKTIDIDDKTKNEFSTYTKIKSDNNKDINKEEAIAIAMGTLEKLYDDVTISSASYYSTSGLAHQKQWNIQFNISSNRHHQGSISIDATTGEITNIHYYNWIRREMLLFDEDFEPALTWEEAYEKAIEVIKAFYPHKLKEIKTQQQFLEVQNYYNGIAVPSLEYHFNFPREAHGITFSHNNISISIDSSTGLLQQMYYRWDEEIDLPKPEGLLPMDDAIELYMTQTKTELVFGAIPQGNQQEQELKLIYRTTPNGQFIYSNIDAKTGNLVDYRGFSVKDEKKGLESIGDFLKGHWGERELTIMHDNGIIDLQNGNLNELIPKVEIIKIINAAFGNHHYRPNEEVELKFLDVTKDDPYYDDIALAVRNGWLANEEKELMGESPMTREDLAVLLVKFAKLDPLAKLEGVYTLPVKDLEDISADKLGYTALIYGLNVMKGDGEYFNPKEEMTLAQASVAIYRSFTNLMNIIRR